MLLNTSELPRHKSLVLVAFSASLSARSLPWTLAYQGLLYVYIRFFDGGCETLTRYQSLLFNALFTFSSKLIEFMRMMAYVNRTVVSRFCHIIVILSPVFAPFSSLVPIKNRLLTQILVLWLEGEANQRSKSV